MTHKNNKAHQARDTGLAIALILLILEYINRPNYLALSAMAVLVLVMTWPAFFKPLSKIWFGATHVLGNIVSRIILTVIFLVILTPVGLIRKALGADPMKRSLWKKDDSSVLVDRNHLYTKKDIENPY